MAKKMGRPLKGESKRNKSMTVRITEDEFDLISDVSMKLGISKSDTIIQAVEELAQRLEE
ncbi:CopG family transcriptional regulator [Streptococcus mitis]|jgi:hypothetical protein|uniref:CopG family transcriptional regulator n=2 Tax=Streptococcus mitis TaxID=28037 RepID=A0A6L5H409_STRMT|nr:MULTISPECIES: CopG family transcriptional regulator [Streptococcus]DAZ01749.1 MAG TPA: NikA, BACTERIAL CONJUGATION, RELAXASE, DNA [Caudoviricetes sp.]MBF9606401.1 CopG family transcriptional regulator [Streptococcus pseudopneumoniae]MBW8144775.1 CopG family transcriptional regulator [Streptococcus pseudopneumoniae]MDU2559919.1 CopG family transcriptional regulator [Streptococcus mitis]MQP59849.1 CopG family transcriptional regulator [Streptococcus mitis]